MFFRYQSKGIVLFFLLSIILGCSSALYQPVPENVSYTELVKGRKLYVAKCGSCHQLHLPKEFSETRWRSNLDEMQVRASISDEEKNTILNFILSDPGFNPGN